MTIDLAIHSFSLWHHFAHAPQFGPIAFIDLVEDLGFTGINLSLNNPNDRHLGGKEHWRMDEVRNRLAEELARRDPKDRLAPVDRDPVPGRFSESVRRYYEELGKP